MDGDRPQAVAAGARPAPGLGARVLGRAPPPLRCSSLGLIVGAAVLLPAAYLAIVVARRPRPGARDRLRLAHRCRSGPARVGLASRSPAPRSRSRCRSPGSPCAPTCPARRLWATLCTLPLVIPTYVGAYLFVAALGPDGLLADALGVGRLPSIYGFPGAFGSCSRCSPIRWSCCRCASALRRIDPQLEDAARAMGRGPLETFRTVVLPQLWPAIAVGGLLVGAVRDQRLRRRLDHALRLVHPRDLHLLQVELRPHRDRSARDGARGPDAGAALGQRPADARRAPSTASAPARRRPPRPYALGRWRWPALGVLLGDRPDRAGAPGRRAHLLGDQGDLGAGGTSFDLAVGLAANSLMTGIGAALAGGLAALVIAVLAGRYPSAADAGDRAGRPRRLRAAGDHRRPGAGLLRHPGGPGALPDPRDADLRAHRPLPAAGDRADQRLAAPGLAPGGGGRAGARAVARRRSSGRSPRRSCAAASSPARARLPARDQGAPGYADPGPDRLQDIGDRDLEPDQIRLLRGERRSRR